MDLQRHPARPALRRACLTVSLTALAVTTLVGTFVPAATAQQSPDAPDAPVDTAASPLEDLPAEDPPAGDPTGTGTDVPSDAPAPVEPLAEPDEPSGAEPSGAEPSVLGLPSAPAAPLGSIEPADVPITASSVATVDNDVQYRAALAALSADPAGPHTITLSASFSLTEPGDPTYTGDQDLTIAGAGHSIDAGGIRRALDARGSTGSITLSILTVTNGLSIDGGDGGAVAASGDVVITGSGFTGSVATGDGGAIHTPGTVQITNSQLTGNSAAGDGGAVYAGSGDVSGSTFTDNISDDDGGAVHFSDPAPLSTVHDSEFVENESVEEAGALWAFSDVLRVTDSTFTDNASTADQAGAVYAWERVEVSGSTFTGNTAFDEAGALDGDDVVITDSTFESNSAGLGVEADGGAVHGDEAMSIADSEFTGNTAAGDGGAAGVRDGTISVTSSTFTGNFAGDEGGAILGQLVVDVTNSTFTDNTSDFEAGAIEAWTGGLGVTTISGSTFTNNSAVSAGGVLDTGAFFISDSTFTGNSTEDDDGGALWAELPSTISGSEFASNSSGDEGGGIYTEAEITITDTSFTENLAEDDGGGVYADTKATVTGSTFIGNVAGDDGGGIAADEAAVSGSTFIGNEADGDGGGLVGVLVSASDSTFTDNDALDGDGGGFDSDDATVAGSSFTGNVASRDGGAFWAEDPSTVEGSTFESNTSARDGGAVFSEDELTVSDSTFSFNSTSGRGGAIAAQESPLALRFVTMSANVADGGGADVATFEPAATMDADGAVFASTGSCFLAGAVAGADNFDTGDSCGFEAASNIVEGGDPVLGPLADNGGTTETQLPGAASPLLLAIGGSSCVAVATGDLAIDQRGLSRPASSSARCSIGAVNTPALVPGTPIDVDATTSADGVELSWSAPDDDGGASVTTYVIESSTDGVTWSSTADVAAASDSSGLTGAALDTPAPSVLGATSVLLPVGAAGTTTQYRVAAVNSAGQGPFSQTASVSTPAAPPTDGSDARRPATLALTGNDSVGLLEFAVMLLAIGLTALMVARRLRRTAVGVRGGLRL